MFFGGRPQNISVLEHGAALGDSADSHLSGRNRNPTLQTDPAGNFIQDDLKSTGASPRVCSADTEAVMRCAEEGALSPRGLPCRAHACEVDYESGRRSAPEGATSSGHWFEAGASIREDQAQNQCTQLRGDERLSQKMPAFIEHQHPTGESGHHQHLEMRSLHAHMCG